MTITRLTKIKRYRVFRDFVWPNDLPEFKQFNIIYGWNGTGKTALSYLFAQLQDKLAITESEVEFEFEFEFESSHKISGVDIPKANYPKVRVFNRDFVARTVKSIDEGSVSPIYYVGAENIAKQNKLETLKAQLSDANTETSKAEDDKKKASKELEGFCVDQAKFIKETLLGSEEHANYHKGSFKQANKELERITPQLSALSVNEKATLKDKTKLKSKNDIPILTISFPKLSNLHSQISTLLSKSVVAEVIDELARDTVVGSWVQEGLSLHKGERHTDICRYCGNKISTERIARIESHFNEALIALQKELEQSTINVQDQREQLKNITLPAESLLYDHLTSDYIIAVEGAKKVIQRIDQILSRYKEALCRKKEKPFEPLTLEIDGGNRDLENDTLKSAIDKVNTIIDKHRQDTANLNDEIKKAYARLEQNYVLEALPRFNELNQPMAEGEIALLAKQQKTEQLNKEIQEIELDIVEHRRPAEELNRELRSYLGHDELTFEVKDTGYVLKRGEQPASHLSEGERTAIAFLYFLKSLKDKDFDLSKGIVVIDDPVSSLDANALFSAFGYMKECTKECHQLIILTHNFPFFRQVKNWFHHLKGPKKPGEFYSLLMSTSGGDRNAALAPMDKLLREYESEYHYLFKQIYDVAHNSGNKGELSHFYGIPNIARRLLETFLAYRYPGKNNKLWDKLENIDFEPAKKTRIIRFLNNYSHAGGISEPEHDPSVLSETIGVMKEILELIQKLDSEHYQGMINLIKLVEAEE